MNARPAAIEARDFAHLFGRQIIVVGQEANDIRLQRPGERGYLRKLVEAATAVALTLRHGRDGVLAHYLRIVPYGHRIHGIGYAARRYLDKPVDDGGLALSRYGASIVLLVFMIAVIAAFPQKPASRGH